MADKGPDRENLYNELSKAGFDPKFAHQDKNEGISPSLIYWAMGLGILASIYCLAMVGLSL